ncbi:carboxypeptidase M32 [bacterium]|nr:MAG: carboxypeptidase M32 [bacterium]
MIAELKSLDAALSLMGWDRQVLMPAGGASARTAHQQSLTAMRHSLLTSDTMRRAAEGFPTLQREIALADALPEELVVRRAKVSNEAYEVWRQAKAENDFPKLAPYLKELFDIAREVSERRAIGNHVYDGLIDLFEQGTTYADARSMFDVMKPRLVSLVQQIAGTDPIPDTLAGQWDPSALLKFATETTGAIGFDFNRGRLDRCANAFCAGTTSGDVRMTTRSSEHLKGILSSSLHEMGHGLYEQGIPKDFDDSLYGGGVSLAVHEASSRLWENIVGRSRPFWNWLAPRLGAAFPEKNLDDAWRAYTRVQPEFIRVGADELTYNLHILVRFELEVEILEGTVEIKDLPDAWNAKYEEYLGITPPSNSLGCMQDVHWSRGSVGYFPTYAMGNLIGGRFWQKITAAVPDWEGQFAEGRFEEVLQWLTENVYQQGSRLEPADLVRNTTGGYLEPEPWLDYAEAKYREVYGL